MTTQREYRRDDDLRKVAALAAAEVVKTASEAAAALARESLSEAKSQSSLMKADLDYIKSDLLEIKTRLDTKYVTNEAFDPIKRLVYGLVTLILTAVVVGVLALLIR